MVSTDTIPAVERAGSDMPNRSVPHSGWPRRAHDASARSVRPIFRSGQPRACAIGRCTASTTGEVARLGGTPVGSMARASGRAAATNSQAMESGAHTSGRGPSRASFQDLPSWAATAYGAAGRTCTSTQCPATVRPPALNVSARSFNTVKWSVAAATVSRTGAPVQPSLPVNRR